jgi:carbamoyltransferase
LLVLGISAFYHDSAAALLRDGTIVAAAQEERFTRRKQDCTFPAHAIDYCIREAGAELSQIDHVAYYEKPFVKFERLVETYLAMAPAGFRSFRNAMPVWLREKLFLKRLLCKELSARAPRIDWENRLLFGEHHVCHAASAFFPSPFAEAAILTADGVGEWATTSIAQGQGNNVRILSEIHFPHSLGLLYSAFTYYTGFKVNSGEYKVMGLAPYGEPKYASLILEHLVDLKPDGSFRLAMEYFDYCGGLRMTNDRFHALFGGEPRSAEDPLRQRDKDLAASIQAVTEEIMVRMSRAVADKTGSRNLCLAGGVALNCVANGKILVDGRIKRLWVQPAAGDAGGALGAAYAAYHGFAKRPRDVDADDAMQGGLLGPAFEQTDIERRLRDAGAKFDLLPDRELFAACASELAHGRALGWFQGRMEFGPRALGARSILADPRDPQMQRKLNLKVKIRESFRPFAPSVLEERAAEWFEIGEPNPYMTVTAEITTAKRGAIPAVTHVDHSARFQTVDYKRHPRYHTLLRAFEDLTGCPVLLNTSFNVRGEPIVCTPEDAFRCFMGTDIETLAIGNCLLSKQQQDPGLRTSHATEFAPD